MCLGRRPQPPGSSHEAHTHRAECWDTCRLSCASAGGLSLQAAHARHTPTLGNDIADAQIEPSMLVLALAAGQPGGQRHCPPQLTQLHVAAMHHLPTCWFGSAHVTLQQEHLYNDVDTYLRVPRDGVELERPASTEKVCFVGLPCLPVDNGALRGDPMAFVLGVLAATPSGLLATLLEALVTARKSSKGNTQQQTTMMLMMSAIAVDRQVLTGNVLMLLA